MTTMTIKAEYKFSQETGGMNWVHQAVPASSSHTAGWRH